MTEDDKQTWDDLGLDQKDQITNVKIFFLFKNFLLKRLSKFVIQKI